MEIPPVRPGIVPLQISRAHAATRRWGTPSWRYRWRSGPRCWCRFCGSKGSPSSWRGPKCCRFPMTSDRSGTESGNTCRTERQMHRGAVSSQCRAGLRATDPEWGYWWRAHSGMKFGDFPFSHNMGQEKPLFRVIFTKLHTHAATFSLQLQPKVWLTFYLGMRPPSWIFQWKHL